MPKYKLPPCTTAPWQQKYAIGKVLGAGGYAIVKLAVHLKVSVMAIVCWRGALTESSP